MNPLAKKVGFMFIPLGFGLLSAKIFHYYIPIFFYVCFLSGILSFFLSIALLKGGGKIFKKFPSTDSENSYLYSTIIALITFGFLATVPLNLDRSFSVWVLNETAESATHLSVKELEFNSSKFFSKSGGEIKRRINEQISIGNLEISESNKIQLTVKGKITWRAIRILSDFFDLNRKYSGY
jgi:hypothetical protein